MKLSRTQRDIARAARSSKTFLEGPAGTGKTTAAVERLAHLLEQGVDPASILVLVPQRTLAFPYYELLQRPSRQAGGEVNIATLGGLAKRAVDLFWPLVADEAGFKEPERRPTFLTLETAQYFMARVIGPVIDERGYFDSVTIDRNRLYSQILDNLNKAAVVDFPIEEIGPRLEDAWTGDPVQLRMYQDVQTCAGLFRQYCLDYNLLDFSLQVELFTHYLWPDARTRAHLTGQYRHLIVDNIEEDTYTTHRILYDWMDECDSVLVIYDHHAGFRRFLGADPESAYTLRDLCERQHKFEHSYVISNDLQTLAGELSATLTQTDPPEPVGDLFAALYYDDHRYHPEMVDWVAAEIASLVHDQGVEPAEIVVLAPFLSDALRFSLANRLEAANVPVKSHRPSRSLREEPAARCLLTLAQLAHPAWEMPPAPFDVIAALMQSLAGLDLIRAQLLAQHGFKTSDGQRILLPFDRIKGDVQQRVTFDLGNRYDRLQAWLAAYREREDGPLELDHFLSRLFGEVLSQPGFGFHDDFDAATITANLIDSARGFRRIIDESEAPNPPEQTLAQEYVTMAGAGIIADQYLRHWDLDAENAVLLAPAYTFLMSNRPVDVQFWLNVGGQGWTQRLYQPLTNPYVLSRQWPPGRKWTDADEVRVNADGLQRLVLGLLQRCRTGIYLGFSELGEQGYEQRGELLDAFQRMLRRLSAE